MALQVDYTATDDTQFEYLARLFQALADPRSSDWKSVAGSITTEFAGNFAREESGAGPWRQLSPVTVAQRRRLGYGPAHPILIREGDLLRSYTRRGASGHIEELSRDAGGWTVNVGSDHPLAETHDQGRGRIPARPVVPLTPASVRNVVAVIEQIILRMERRVR